MRRTIFRTLSAAVLSLSLSCLVPAGAFAGSIDILPGEKAPRRCRSGRTA